LVCDGKNFGVHVRIGADEIKTFIRALLPRLLRRARQLSLRVIKGEDFSVVLAFSRHLVRARLAHSNAVPGSMPREDDLLTDTADFVQVASDVIPAEQTVDGKTKGGGGNREMVRCTAQENC